MSSTYSEKLKDPRWLCRRQEIIRASDNCCEECERTAEELLSEQKGALEVHHGTYILGREPWDYPDDVLICLCRKCHFNRQIEDEEALFELARMIRRMPQWHVHSFAKTLRAELDGGWAPKLYDALKRLREMQEESS